MEIELSELQWDEFNVGHIAKHGVSVSEVEQSIGNIVYVDETYGGRYLLVCRTNLGRMISIVLVNVGNNTYYPVTARDSSRGERKKAHDKENK